MKLLVEAGHRNRSENLLHFHRQVRFMHTTEKASALNIKFHVAGVVDVPRMRIDRCIK